MIRSKAIQPRHHTVAPSPGPKRTSSEKPTKAGHQLLPPQAPRLKRQRSLLEKIQHRWAKLVAPAAARAQRTQEKASQKTHEATRLLLAHLLVDLPSPEAIDGHLDRINRASRPLTNADAHQATDAFRKCLRMQLFALPPEDLDQLQARVDLAPSGQRDAVLRGLVREIDALRKGRQDLLKCFDEAFQASERNDPATMDDQLSQAQGKAVRLLQNYQLVGPAEDPVALGEALLKPLCALWLQGQPADDEQLKRFFQAMPASRQAAWLAAGPQHMSVDGRAVDRLLKKAIAQTEETLVVALRDACKAAYEQPSIETLVKLADAWAALQKHCNTLNRPTAAAGFQHRVAMTTRLASEHLKLPDRPLDALSDQELHPLSQALQTLNIPHDPQAFVREIAERQAFRREPCAESLQRALRQLANGDLDVALGYLAEVDRQFESLVPIHEALAGRRLDIDGRTELAYRLFQEVFKTAAPQTLKSAFATLNDEQTLLLTQVLMNMGLQAEDDDATDKAAFSRIGTQLLLLKGALAQQLQKTGEMKSLSKEQAQAAAGLLDRKTFAIAFRFTDGLVQRPME